MSIIIQTVTLCCAGFLFCSSTASGQSYYPGYAPQGTPQSARAFYPSPQNAGPYSAGVAQYNGPRSVVPSGFTQGSSGADEPQVFSPEQPSSGRVLYSPTPSAPDPADERAGLLGSSYLDAQYIFLSAPSDLEYADPFRGVRGTVNTPILWDPGVQDFFFTDIFVSARHLGMTGEIPDTFFPAGLDMDWNTWAIGTTLFADVTPSFRPFIQLGYQYDDARFLGRSELVQVEERDSRYSVLLNFGSEFDITDNLGARIALDLDNFDLGDSFLTLEQIYWCTPSLFLRGGLIGDVDSTTIGAVLGGGVSF